PNPFNPSTRLRFDLPERAAVRLVVYDVAGRAVRVLVEETLGAGSYEETWDGRTEQGEDAASGVYWARLDAAGRTETTRLSLVR
ncbi:MAG: T9SS C-terminal target domain-containing protein, partial [Candidatus Latescibacterota bacterium]